MNDLTLLEKTMNDFFGLTETKRDYASKMFVDYETTDDGYIVKAELPGIDEDAIDVNVENGIMTITAEYKNEDEFSLRKGKYKWAATLKDVDTDNIEASLDKGVLTLNLPKSEKAKPRRIAIGKK